MLDVLCSFLGINTGTEDCAPQPGVFKYFGVWSGSLSKDQLAAGYATCKAALIANSKLSRASSGKFMLFPIVNDAKPKKEANTVAKLPDGSEQVTLEAVPKFDLIIKTDMYQGPQLRKLNNKRLKYVIIDDKNQLLGSRDENDAFVGRSGKIFVDGIDAHGYDTQDGQTNISVVADTATETFDNAACIQLDRTPDKIFKSLKDIQLYEKVAATPVLVGAGSVAHGDIVVGAIGTNGDHFVLQEVDADGVSNPIALADYVKSSGETTVTAVASAVKALVTNPEFVMSGAAGDIIATHATVGASNNGRKLFLESVAGGNQYGVMAGGVDATHSTILHVSGKMISPNANALVDFYGDYAASALGTNMALWVFTRTSTGANVPVTALAPNAAGYFDVTPTPATVASMASGETLEGKLVDPPALDAALVLNIESISFLYTKP